MPCFVALPNLAFHQALTIERFMGELPLTIFPANDKSVVLIGGSVIPKKVLFPQALGDHGSLQKL